MPPEVPRADVAKREREYSINLGSVTGAGNMTSQPYPPLARMKTVFRVSAKYSSKSANAPTKEGTSEYDKAAFHSRRSHTKSRNGCVNCKRRRIKVSKQPAAPIRQDRLVEA
jgi:hypothetical protein